MSILLLDAFRNTFAGRVYKHRVSTVGDLIASFLFEDLLDLARSPKYLARVRQDTIGVNAGNRIKGKTGRRGDGTLGEFVPSAATRVVPGYSVKRGPVATLEIGTEMKIVATKMLAQIDRVITDLNNQAEVFRRLSPDAIRIAIVGVNFAEQYTGREGRRAFQAKTPPAREAPEIVRRINELVRPHFDELLLLKFKATNRPPYPFAWLDEEEAVLEYQSILVRVSTRYEKQF